MPKDEHNKRQPPSPYKKVREKNSTHEPYTQMKDLTKNKPYNIVGITTTSHPTYGTGQAVHVVDHKKKRNKINLPKKYLKDFSEEDTNFMKDDIKEKFPFLIYRETMPDNSYRIDLLPESHADINNLHLLWLDVPEVESSLEE